jgi:hypothetical protein
MIWMGKNLGQGGRGDCPNLCFEWRKETSITSVMISASWSGLEPRNSRIQAYSISSTPSCSIGYLLVSWSQCTVTWYVRISGSNQARGMNYHVVLCFHVDGGRPVRFSESISQWRVLISHLKLQNKVDELWLAIRIRLFWRNSTACWKILVCAMFTNLPHGTPERKRLRHPVHGCWGACLISEYYNTPLQCSVNLATPGINQMK